MSPALEKSGIRLAAGHCSVAERRVVFAISNLQNCTREHKTQCRLRLCLSSDCGLVEQVQLHKQHLIEDNLTYYFRRSTAIVSEQ